MDAVDNETAPITRAEVDRSVDRDTYAPLIGRWVTADQMDELNRPVLERAAAASLKDAFDPDGRFVYRTRWFTGRVWCVLHGLAKVDGEGGEAHDLVYDDATEQWVAYSRPNGLVVGVYDGPRDRSGGSPREPPLGRRCDAPSRP
jgi:hypothetical protein